MSSVKKDILYICEICQTPLEEHNCKAICPNCGRMCDCSDLPVMQANASVDESGDITPRRGSERDFLPPVMLPGPPKSGEVDNLP